MKRKTVVFGVVCVAASVSILATAGGADNPDDPRSCLSTGVNYNAFQQDGIEYYLATDKKCYNLGENVQITFRVTNQRDVERNLGPILNCDKKHDFSVFKQGEKIWDSLGVLPPCGYVDFVLGPNGSWEYVQTWNQTNENGTLTQSDDLPVGAGTYILTGRLRKREASVSLEFVVK